MTIDWAELGLRTIYGRTFRPDNVFHQVVARLQREIRFLLLQKTGVKKILTDPNQCGITDCPPDLAEQFNFYRYEPGRCPTACVNAWLTPFPLLLRFGVTVGVYGPTSPS